MSCRLVCLVRRACHFTFRSGHDDAGLFEADLLFFGFDRVEFVAGCLEAADLDEGFSDSECGEAQFEPHVLQLEAELVKAHFGCVVLANNEMYELEPRAWLLHLGDCVGDVH